jgi:hypothetical protein
MTPVRLTVSSLSRLLISMLAAMMLVPAVAGEVPEQAGNAQANVSEPAPDAPGDAATTAAATSGYETAGRVLMAVGPATAVGPDGRPRRLSRGAKIFAGDTVETSADGHVQLRFTDGGLLSIRPGTVFRVDEYRFDEDEKGFARAFFSLLKGGLRTITGIIGTRNEKAYRVSTPVATIGKRGTHYALYLCLSAECGSRADVAEGLYGGVVEGAVSVTNGGGEAVFATDQYFHVAGFDAPPEPLIRPPAILFGGSDGDSAGQGPRAAAGGRNGGDGASREDTSDLFGVSGSAEGYLVAEPPVFTAGDTREGAAGTRAIDAAATPKVGDVNRRDIQVDAGQEGVRRRPVAMVSFLQSGPAGSPAQAVGRAWVVDKGLIVANVEPADKAVIEFKPLDNSFATSDPATRAFFAQDATLAASPDSGTIGVPRRNQINWGRWNDGGYVLLEGGDVLNAHGLSYVYSPDAFEPPIQGAASFTYHAGPGPVDHLGQVGTVDDARVRVDFGGQEVTGFDLKVLTPGRDWGAALVGGRPVPFNKAFSGELLLEGICTGCSTATIGGSASLEFVGAGAEHAISAFGLSTSDHLEGVAGSMVLRRLEQGP